MVEGPDLRVRRRRMLLDVSYRIQYLSCCGLARYALCMGIPQMTKIDAGEYLGYSKQMSLKEDVRSPPKTTFRCLTMCRRERRERRTKEKGNHRAEKTMTDRHWS